jgi:hypothetical protein
MPLFYTRIATVSVLLLSGDNVQYLAWWEGARASGSDQMASLG